MTGKRHDPLGRYAYSTWNVNTQRSRQTRYNGSAGGPATSPGIAASLNPLRRRLRSSRHAALPQSRLPSYPRLGTTYAEDQRSPPNRPRAASAASGRRFKQEARGPYPNRSGYRPRADLTVWRAEHGLGAGAGQCPVGLRTSPGSGGRGQIVRHAAFLHRRTDPVTATARRPDESRQNQPGKPDDHENPATTAMSRPEIC